MTDDVAPREPTGIYALSDAQRWELARALLTRPQRIADGRAALRAKYPQAPEEMIRTATHHVYVDGPGAVVDFLAEAELAIRDPAHEIGFGTASELLYHVYNWLQFRALLPDGRADVLELVKQMRQAVEENDPEFIRATLEDLEQVVEGMRDLPDVGV
jgi:hypothetical protein